MTNPRYRSLLALLLIPLGLLCQAISQVFTPLQAQTGVTNQMDNATLVLVGVLFILTVLLIAAFAVIVNFGNRAFNALPEWAENFFREQAPATLTALEGHVDRIVVATPTKVDDELWAELKPRIRTLLVEILKDTPEGASIPAEG